MTVSDIYQILGICVIAAPAILFAILGVAPLIGHPLGENAKARATQITVITGLFAAIAILIMMLLTGDREVTVQLGHWVVLHDQHFHFQFKLVFDRLSVPFAILSFILCGTIGAFANVYLHRERGYIRFFVLYSAFLLGMILSAVAGTIETLFIGWELVGLSSALLVAYFHERKAPLSNGLQVWTIYRIADAAFIVAALTLHHMTGEGDFAGMMGAGPWPDSQAVLSSNQALFVGLLLLIAAAGKSALVPFSGWLPRAMEGPTPSSAIFYGALSVHLGAFLLLRVSPLLEASIVLQVAVVFLGLITAIYALLAARVQTDIKSALAFAALTQVGIIVVEIGCGLRYLALIHLIGHAFLRTLQLVRAPTLLHDYHSMENAIGGRLSSGAQQSFSWMPETMRRWLFCFSLERGFLDTLLSDYVARPLLAVFRWCDQQERRWTNFLEGGQSRESDRIPPGIEPVKQHYD